MTERINVDNLYAKELAAKDMRLYRGWGYTVLKDLVHKSREEQILKFTPNDAARRFSDVEAAESWCRDDGRTLYTLYDHNIDLAGIIWYSHSPKPELDADYTFAIRMYDIARGRKLAQGFMNAVHSDWSWRNRRENVWLETDTDNATARHLYEQFGYEQVDETDGRVTMLYKS